MLIKAKWHKRRNISLKTQNRKTKKWRKNRFVTNEINSYLEMKKDLANSFGLGSCWSSRRWGPREWWPTRWRPHPESRWPGSVTRTWTGAENRRTKEPAAARMDCCSEVPATTNGRWHLRAPNPSVPPWPSLPTFRLPLQSTCCCRRRCSLSFVAASGPRGRRGVRSILVRRLKLKNIIS